MIETLYSMLVGTKLGGVGLSGVQFPGHACEFEGDFLQSLWLLRDDTLQIQLRRIIRNIDEIRKKCGGRVKKVGLKFGGEIKKVYLCTRKRLKCPIGVYLGRPTWLSW
jgi:hypothetical protein